MLIKGQVQNSDLRMGNSFIYRTNKQHDLKSPVVSHWALVILKL